MEFSSETISKLRYYVYRLIDPRNGQTFYIGKGKGNRVFQHALGAIDYYDGINKEEHDFQDDPNKLRIIYEIKENNLEVIYLIHRWNLTEKEAIEVKAALIDCYSGLSDIQTKYGSKFGVCNAIKLETSLSTK